jgi:glycerophosphoryl diester phosphodiesterase
MNMLTIGHRGGRGLWPENTLHAFARAIDAGIDGAELDVQLTRDGALAVAHDFRIGPATWRMDRQWWRGPKMRIHDLTVAQLREFDVGATDTRSAYGKLFPRQEARDGERLPLLTDVFDLIGMSDFPLLIEIKTAWHDRALSATPEEVTEATLAAMRDKGFLDRATLVSFDWRALIHAGKREPRVACWYLTLPHGNDGWKDETAWAAGFLPSDYGSIAKAIAAAGGQGWLAFHADATQAPIEEAHALGLKVGVWNVNDAEDIRMFARRGVDAICSDYPGELVEALKGSRSLSRTVEEP